MALTKNDFLKLKELFYTRGELDERLKIFLTRDEFLTYMDKLMKELEIIRDEQTMTPSHTDLANLEERVEKIEQQTAAS